MTATYALGRGFALRRMFDAPPELVFQAWTDPELLTWFFNPGMPVDTDTSVDLRVGGQWRQQMNVNASTNYITGGVFREIVPGKKLVFFWGAVDGWPEVDLDDLEAGPLVTVVFTPEGDRTAMDFRLQLPDQLSQERTDEWMKMGIGAGWGMTIDRLVEHLNAPERASA